jgi:predicted nuclease of predicted toxin-antitoxin system
MRLLADENVHGKVVQAMREHGFDVEWVAESSHGMIDQDILGRDDISEFIFITNDSDFGDLIFSKGMPAPKVMLYTKLPHRDWQFVADRLIAALEDNLPARHIITISPDQNRMRPFPSGA